MPKTTAEYMQLASQGTHLKIDASAESIADLIMIAGSVGLAGGHLTLTTCDSKSTADLIMIKGIYPKNITFNFTTS
jgi:riboflavin synthase alpha subunit